MNINFYVNGRKDIFKSKTAKKKLKEKMKKYNFNLGGEQSGHIILGKFATTGDGLLVALEVLYSLKKGVAASKLFNIFKPVPQILENIIVKNKEIIKSAKCKNIIKQTIKIMGNKGRILVRKSGTEPKIRVMAESYDKILIKKCILKLRKIIK